MPINTPNPHATQTPMLAICLRYLMPYTSPLQSLMRRYSFYAHYQNKLLVSK